MSFIVLPKLIPLLYFLTFIAHSCFFANVMAIGIRVDIRVKIKVRVKVKIKIEIKVKGYIYILYSY